MIGDEVVSQTLWLIADQSYDSLGVFTIQTDRGEEVLPVFSHVEDARAFLRARDLETHWRVRETMAGELVSLLYGLCAGVEKVALDPPASDDGSAVDLLVSLERRDLIQILVGERVSHPGPRDK